MTESVGLKPFNEIKYVTLSGENCIATKKDGIVTIKSDKNSTRQIPYEKFMQDFIKDQSTKSFERSPQKDTINFKGRAEKNVNNSYNKEYFNNLKQKKNIANVAALIGTGSVVGTIAMYSKIQNPKLQQIGIFGGLALGLIGACFGIDLAEKIEICKLSINMNK